MNFNEIFDAYYTQYRAEATVPSSTDDEYTIGLRLANEALNRWANYDATYWKELFSTNQTDGSGTQTITTGVTTYNAPDYFREAGGSVNIKNSAGNTVRSYPILEPHEMQFKSDNMNYCYFTRGQIYHTAGTASQSATTVTGVGTTFTSNMVGMQIVFDSGETSTITGFTSTTVLTVSVSKTVASTTYKIVNKGGYTLNINPAPDSSINGFDIDYVFYKYPTEYTSGDSISEIPDPYFIVHRMLTSRFRASRNPYYSSAKTDAENALKQMQMDNNAGSWANPWKLPDNSGSKWGE